MLTSHAGLGDEIRIQFDDINQVTSVPVTG